MGKGKGALLGSATGLIIVSGLTSPECPLSQTFGAFFLSYRPFFMNKTPIIILAGGTGVGTSTFSLEIAKKFNI